MFSNTGLNVPVDRCDQSCRMTLIGRTSHSEHYSKVYENIDLTKVHHLVTFRVSGSIMDSFADLMNAFAVSQCGVDIVAALPIEIAELVLQKLDPRSLLNVVRVSRTWMKICKSSSRLRKAVRAHLRKQKRRMIQNDLALVKQSKKKILSNNSRMKSDLTQRSSRQNIVSIPAFAITGLVKSGIPNNRSKDKNPFSRACVMPTKSTLQLR